MKLVGCAGFGGLRLKGQKQSAKGSQQRGWDPRWGGQRRDIVGPLCVKLKVGRGWGVVCREW